jgi:hypothetical protein
MANTITWFVDSEREQVPCAKPQTGKNARNLGIPNAVTAARFSHNLM